MAVSLKMGEGLLIPDHVQEKLSSGCDAPPLDEWLTERLTPEHKIIYGKLMMSRLQADSSADRFPVDFDELYVQLGYAQKQTAEEKLLKHYVENDDFFLRENPKNTGQRGRPGTKYGLTLDCAKRFALGAGTAVGEEMRSFFVDTLDAVQDYHILTLVASERKRAMEEKHKFLIQQNKGVSCLYILDMGTINGIRLAKVGSTDDPAVRFGGLTNDLKKLTSSSRECLNRYVRENKASRWAVDLGILRKVGSGP